MDGFVTPPNHQNFLAKKLFERVGVVRDGAIAYLEADGGGPLENHTHEHDHLFIVTKGQAKIMLDGRAVIVNENESFLVNGGTPHSVWNNLDTTTAMIGLSVEHTGKE